MEPNASTRPFELFEEWMAEAKANSAIREPTAMSLATLDPDGQLRARVVLCKSWSDAGFTFYTNYNSLKGRALAANPRAAGVFYWDPLFRQVRFSGDVRKVSREESVAYWNSRARESQLSQWISRQSERIDSREELERLWTEAEKRFQGQPVPCPEHWGGFLIAPREIEFWIGRPGRLHDRYVYEKTGSTWTFHRLCP